MIESESPPRTYKYHLEADESGNLLNILKDEYGFSSRILRKVRNEGKLLVNGHPVKLKSDVNGGDHIEVTLPEEKLDASPSHLPIDIIYEDDEIVAVSKSPELVVHPTRSHPDGTLANRIAGHAEEEKESYKIRFVNRLDRDTSGILIIAKNKFVHHYIQSRMKTDEVEKTYLVYVEDNPDHPIPDEGTINVPIGRPQPESIKREVMEEGQKAVTHYKVISRYKNAAKLEVKLETGRTHQIRVHTKAIGHPIIGDPLYNPESIERYGIERQALHAYKLKIPLPKKGEILLEAALPEDLKQLENRLERIN